MLRHIPALAALMLLSAACIGGGDKKPAMAPTTEPEATATVSATAPESTPGAAEPTSEPDESAASDTAALSTVLDSVLGGGLGSATGSTPSFGGGDPALKAYLPSADQYPPGFVPFGEFTYSLPDGVSQDGKLDVAASMAVSGDPAATTQGDFSKVGMLMTMVMHPDDLQALGDAFATIDDVDPATLEAEIRRGMEQAGVVGGMEVTNVRAYELDLGDGGFGMEMTFDIGGLFESLLGGTGLEGQAPPFEAMSMRMYIFANGDYVGAVMRMAYADAVPDDGAELALARSIDSNLAAAP